MTVTLVDFNHTNTRKDLPQIRTGQVVKVHQKISETKVTGKKTETKERIQVFEGLVIGMRGKTGMNATITVRKISDGIGVERVFPINTPTIEKIEIVKITKARRAKLNYMRNRFGKATKPKGELATDEHNKPNPRHKSVKGVKKEEIKEEIVEDIAEETKSEIVEETTETPVEEIKEESVEEKKAE